MNSQFLLTLAPFVRELARLSITRSDSSPPKLWQHCHSFCGTENSQTVPLRGFQKHLLQKPKKQIHIYTHTHTLTLTPTHSSKLSAILINIIIIHLHTQTQAQHAHKKTRRRPTKIKIKINIKPQKQYTQLWFIFYAKTILFHFIIQLLTYACARHTYVLFKL